MTNSAFSSTEPVQPHTFSHAAKLLRVFCRPVGTADYAGGTAKASLDNALAFILKTVPNFLELATGKSVLDFGCGFGFQATALAQRGIDVVGLDLPRPVFRPTWEDLMSRYPVILTTEAPRRKFDLVYSCSSFEHFDDPDAILATMRDLTAPGGRIVITFAEPWLSPHGSHMDGFCLLPWVNLLWSERDILTVRSLYRSDGAMRFADVEGGLNQMTVNRFEKIMQRSGMQVESLTLFATWGLPLVTKVPILRELLTSACASVLKV